GIVPGRRRVLDPEIDERASDRIALLVVEETIDRGEPLIVEVLDDDLAVTKDASENRLIAEKRMVRPERVPAPKNVREGVRPVRRGGIDLVRPGVERTRGGRDQEKRPLVDELGRGQWQPGHNRRIERLSIRAQLCRYDLPLDASEPDEPDDDRGVLVADEVDERLSGVVAQCAGGVVFAGGREGIAALGQVLERE